MKHRTLLCVDDDPRIRDLYGVLLASHGYEVLVAEDGRQALQLFHANEQEIDAVISDYEMPGMNGAELATELKRCNPTLPVIMISGYDLSPAQTAGFADAALAKGTAVEQILNCLETLVPLQTTERVAVPLPLCVSPRVGYGGHRRVRLRRDLKLGLPRYRR